jgi:hypothetical protein
MGQNGIHNRAEMGFFRLPGMHRREVRYGRVELEQWILCRITASEEHIELGEVSFQPGSSGGDL